MIPASLRKKIYFTIVVVVLAAAVGLAVSSSWRDSLIVDEVPHIGAGYSYLTQHDMRLNPEHPPLAKDLAAVPLLFLNLDRRAFQQSPWTTDINGQWDFGRSLIFNSGNDADLIKHLARLPLILFFIISAVLIFSWSRKLYGDGAGLLALTLFSFSPTILAHSRFVTTDMAALFGILIASYFFIKFLNKQDKGNIIIAGLILGLALLSKFSTFLLIPYFLLLAIIWSLGKNFKAYAGAVSKTILIFVIGFVVVVWPIYYLNSYNYPPDRQKSDTQAILGSNPDKFLSRMVVWASDKPIIRPAAEYGLGLLMVNQRSSGGNTTYFLGEVSRLGSKIYFPVVYFIKEPLSWWFLAFAALLLLLWQIKSRLKKPIKNLLAFCQRHFAEMAMLLWLAIYWGISVNSNLNIGVRHLLPIFPFSIILVSGQIQKISEKTKALGAVFANIFVFGLSFMLSWYILENIKTYPFYLAYFNQTAGGPSGGYRYVVDSNLDWGQDLIRLSDWVKTNNIPRIEVDYFGWANPVYYLGQRMVFLNVDKYKSAQDFEDRNQTNGWMAVSATFIQNSVGPKDQPAPNNYLWLNDFRPITVIGHSIFVYKIQ